LFFYTPLNGQTPLCIVVGALPGAMPPVIGCAANGKSSLGGKGAVRLAVGWQPHGDCMDMSRGLCAGGLSGSARF
jgi:heme O synthase-like polyprenyltransferase